MYVVNCVNDRVSEYIDIEGGSGDSFLMLHDIMILVSSQMVLIYWLLSFSVGFAMEFKELGLGLAKG